MARSSLERCGSSQPSRPTATSRTGRTACSRRNARPVADSRASAIDGTSTTVAPRRCSTSPPGSPKERHVAAVRALAARVGRHVGHPVAVNIDGALAVSLTALRLDPEYGDFLFAIARSFGLAAHIVEERDRERPMRLIDPTAAFYDGVPVPDSLAQETDR